ncbi:MAG: L,D-transpeptidase family protein [Epulopiscium sp.]|nr:L,D-transpeptidase family protein [Candidatus Epulonipiscium sp.]
MKKKTYLDLITKMIFILGVTTIILGLGPNIISAEENKPREMIDFGVELGILQKGTAKALINGYWVPSFTHEGYTMIALADLNNYGFDIKFDNELKKISVNKSEIKEVTGFDEEQIENKERSLIGKPMVHTNLSIYIGNRKIPCYAVEGSTFIYFNDLSLFGYLEWNSGTKEASLLLNDNIYKNDLQVELAGNKIINNNNSNIDLSLVHIWHNEKSKENTIVQDSVYEISENAIVEFNVDKFELHQKNIYLGTVVKGSNLLENPFYEQDLDYYQSKKIIGYALKLYKTPEEKLLSLVKPSIIIGTMKKAAGGFQNGEKVEILYAQSGYWYECKSLTTEKKGRIPWGSVDIPRDPPTNKNQMTKEEVESYANLKGFTSNTNYFVWTDLDRQMTHVLKKENGKWKLLRSMLSSTGKNITPTPRGSFTIKDRGAYFGKGYMCKNWVRIWGDYLYHSILMDVTGSYILETNVLGKRASQGCIRLSLENSKWFYNTVPTNTAVWIN